MNESHLRQVREIYQIAARADWETLAKYLHDDFFVLTPDHVPHTGRYEGIEGFKQVFGIVFGNYQDLNLTQNAFCSGDNHVMVLLDFAGANKHTGESFSIPMIELFRFADDKLIEIRPFYWNHKILNDMLNES